MTIWVASNNKEDLRLGVEVLTNEFRCMVFIFSTELEFRKKVEAVKAGSVLCPDLALLSLNLRWTHPSPKMEMPPPAIAEEINRRGEFATGFRLRRLLAETASTRRIPVIVRG